MKQEQVLFKMKDLCASVTESTYTDTIQRGHELLTILYDAGLSREQVYQPLAAYHDSLEDGMIRDCVADVLDFVVGWCSPQMELWRSD